MYGQNYGSPYSMYGYGDGFFGSLWKGVKAVGKFVVKNPIVSTALAVIPGGGLISKGLSIAGKVFSSPVGKAVTAGAALGAGLETGMAISRAMTPTIMQPGQAGLPALPSAGGGGMPGQPGGGAIMPYTYSPGSFRTSYGRARQRQRLPMEFQQYGLDPQYIKAIYRPPRGYVLVTLVDGNRMAMRRQDAIALNAWFPGRKAPISAGEWHQYQTARRIEKKLVKIARHALHAHRRPAPQQNVVKFHRKAA